MIKASRTTMRLWTDREGYEIYVIGGDFTPCDPDVANDFALVVTHGTGEGNCFKILGYDYSAPRQWVPTGTYIEPDKWTDHVGDLAYGYWDVPNRQRFIVDKYPTGLIMHDLEPSGRAQLEIKPALLVDEHGTSGTFATSHTEATVSAVPRCECADQPVRDLLDRYGPLARVDAGRDR